MKYSDFLLIVGLLLWTACSKSSIEDDEKNIKRVLTDYFDGIKSHNRNKMNENTTSDYVLFENGKVWNNDSLWQDIQSFKDQTIQFRFDNFKFIIDNNIGHVSYHNHGDIFIKDTLNNTIEWIENATFIKENNKWIIAFLHSTPRKKY